MPRFLARCKPLCLVLVLCGCPKRFDPRAEPALTSPDAKANEEYQLARSLLERRQAADAAQRFGQFVATHPSDPLVDAARVNQARALYLVGKCDEALPLVQPLAAQPIPDDLARRIVVQRARLQEGLCAHRRGDLQLAEQRLAEIAEQVAPGDEANEIHAVLADLYLQRGNFPLAEREYQRFSGYATAAEHAYIAEQAQKFCQSRPECLSRFVSAEQRSEIKAERGQLKIGVILPLSGKSRGLGERALRGVLLGMGLIDGDSGKLEIEVADTRSDPKRVGELVQRLATRGADLIIGSPDKGEAMVASTAAESVPLVSLVAEDGGSRPGLFHAVASRSTAARALAEHGLAASPGKRAAMLFPDSNYGRTIAAAFAERWQQGGGVIIGELKYKESSTTFIHDAKKLRALSPDIVFVPAPSSQLQLIAPQLASTGIVAMANVPAQGKPAMLLAMADGLTAQQLLGMGKYIQQAVLAVLFTSSAEDAATVEMSKRYRAAFGEEPSLLDAVSFDAATAARRALGEAGEDSAAIGARLAAQRFAGATGEMAFSSSGQRAGKVRLYTVRGTTLQPVP